MLQEICIQLQKNRDVEAVKEMVQNRVDVNSQRGLWKYMPIHLAIAIGRTDCADFFLLRGVNINATNKENETCLHLAASNSHCDMVSCSDSRQMFTLDVESAKIR